jgi:hypothetical protein
VEKDEKDEINNDQQRSTTINNDKKKETDRMGIGQRRNKGMAVIALVGGGAAWREEWCGRRRAVWLLLRLWRKVEHRKIWKSSKIPTHKSVLGKAEGWISSRGRLGRVVFYFLLL